MPPTDRCKGIAPLAVHHDLGASVLGISFVTDHEQVQVNGVDAVNPVHQGEIGIGKAVSERIAVKFKE